MKMTPQIAMSQYGKTDKEHFPCYNGFDDDERPNSTFFADFCVAEAFLGTEPNAIQDTFDRCKEWKNDAKMWTELTIVLNHLIWIHHHEGDDTLGRLYDKLWREADDHAHTFTGDDAKHYFGVTD